MFLVWFLLRVVSSSSSHWSSNKLCLQVEPRHGWNLPFTLNPTIYFVQFNVVYHGILYMDSYFRDERWWEYWTTHNHTHRFSIKIQSFWHGKTTNAPSKDGHNQCCLVAWFDYSRIKYEGIIESSLKLCLAQVASSKTVCSPWKWCYRKMLIKSRPNCWSVAKAHGLHPWITIMEPSSWGPRTQIASSELGVNVANTKPGVRTQSSTPGASTSTAGDWLGRCDIYGTPVLLWLAKKFQTGKHCRSVR